MKIDVDGKVLKIIAEQAVINANDIHYDRTLASLGIDSLGLVEAIFALEDAFDITVPFNANSPQKSDFDMSSVGAIVDAVKDLIAQKAT